MGYRHPYGAHRAEEVNVEKPHRVLNALRFHGSGYAEAGVIYKHIDAPFKVKDRVYRAPDGELIRHVGCYVAHFAIV